MSSSGTHAPASGLLRRDVGAAVVLVVACAWTFAPALHGGWLWDDGAEIPNNPALRTSAGLAAIWLGRTGPDYFPLKSTVQWLEWHAWGAEVSGYHGVNAALHMCGAFLAWKVFSRLGIRAAFFGSVLFAVHPLVVESAAWISELKNVLSLPLVLGAFLCWLRFDATGRFGSYAASWLLFVAALLAKTSVVMLPAILLLHALWKRGRVSRRDFARSLPFFAAALALGLATVHFQHTRVMAHFPDRPEGLAIRIAAAGGAILFYVQESVWPAVPLPIYRRWAFHPLEPWHFLPWIGIAAAFGWFWTQRKGWGRHAFFGFGTFVANLAPVLGLIPMAFLRISRVSDHLAYLPFVSLAGLAGAGVGYGLGSRGKTFTGIIAACILGLLAWRSRAYARMFANETALWTYTLQHNAGAWLAHNNLGINLAMEGNLDRAIEEGLAAVRLRPAYPEARTNLGVTLTQAGRLTEAIEQLQAAVQLDPTLSGAHLDLGRALLKSHQLEQAVVQFEAAHQLDPQSGDARSDLRASLNNLGNSLARDGRTVEAVAEYQRAIAADPNDPGVRRNLGFALHTLGKNADAMAQFEEADRLEKMR